MFNWIFRPSKRCFPPGHPFFEDGDIYCTILLKQLFVPESVEEFISSTSPEFKCEVTDCNDYFHSIAEYEAHYNSLHRNCCTSCHRSFPSNYLLDIHITENHDPLFQTLATRNIFMFRCLVESCPDKFSLEKERKKHLIKIHKYPSDFRFNRPCRKKKGAGKIETKLAVLDISMDVDVDKCHDKRVGIGTATEAEPTQIRTNHPKPPRTVCFGRGSARSFHKHHFTKKSKNAVKHAGKNNYDQDESMQE